MSNHLLKTSPKERTRVLLVEDDPEARRLFADALRENGYDVVAVSSATEATAELAARPFPAAVLDIFLPDGRGLSVLAMLREKDPQAVAIVVTGYASLDTALEALRLGAYEYLCKPFSSDELVRALARGLERRELILGNLRLAQRLAALAQQLEAQGQRMHGQIQAAADTLAVFAEMSKGITSTPNPLETLTVMCHSAARLAKASLAAIIAFGQQAPQVAAVYDEEGRLAPGQLLSAPALLEVLAQRAQPLVVDDLLFGDDLRDDYLASLGLSSAVVLPIGPPAQVAGALLCAHEQPRAFAEEMTSLLALIAAQAAPVLEHWRRSASVGDADSGFIEIDRLL
jgi:DNA-binding response OmpR family regulator